MVWSGLLDGETAALRLSEFLRAEERQVPAAVGRRRGYYVHLNPEAGLTNLGNPRAVSLGEWSSGRRGVVFRS